MEVTSIILSLTGGLGIGGLLVYLWQKSAITLATAEAKAYADRLTQAEAECLQLRIANGALRENMAKNEGRQSAEAQAFEDKLSLLKEAESRLLNLFKVTSNEALKLSQEAFAHFAQNHFSQWQNKAEQAFEIKNQAIGALVTPLKLALTQVDAKMGELEKARMGAYGALTEQVKGLLSNQLRLEKETRTLVQALRSPQVRGQWGEIQLKRVVEMAGMLANVDFYEQVSFTQDTKRLRPDMIVRMPNGRSIVVDSKVPLEAYLEALETEDEVIQKTALTRHARQVKDRMTELGSKGYWKELKESPEFVVLFLPAEPFLSAALAEDPELLEWGSRQGVIPATPSTLLALLKTVAYGWKQDAMAQEAKTISALGRELYERIVVLAEHWEDLRRSLEKAGDAYNKALSSLESRVLPTARKLQTLHASTERALPALKKLENLQPKSLMKTEETTTES